MPALLRNTLNEYAKCAAHARGRGLALDAYRVLNPFLELPRGIFTIACLHGTAPALFPSFRTQGELHVFPAGLRRRAPVRRGDRLPRAPVRGSRRVGCKGPHEDRVHGLLQDQQLFAERTHGNGESGDHVFW